MYPVSYNNTQNSSAADRARISNAQDQLDRADQLESQADKESQAAQAQKPDSKKQMFDPGGAYLKNQDAKNSTSSANDKQAEATKLRKDANNTLAQYSNNSQSLGGIENGQGFYL